MNRDDIIRMAREAGLTLRGHYDEPGSTPQELERFAALVAAAEREECAQIAEIYEPDVKQKYVEYASSEIRRRGNP